MPLRILSGFVFIPQGGIQEGRAVIGFDPFELLMSSEPAFELRQKRAIGPAAYIVPARQF